MITAVVTIASGLQMAARNLPQHDWLVAKIL